MALIYLRTSLSHSTHSLALAQLAMFSRKAGAVWMLAKRPSSHPSNRRSFNRSRRSFYRLGAFVRSFNSGSVRLGTLSLASWFINIAPSYELCIKGWEVPSACLVWLVYPLIPCSYASFFYFMTTLFPSFVFFWEMITPFSANNLPPPPYYT